MYQSSLCVNLSTTHVQDNTVLSGSRETFAASKVKLLLTLGEAFQNQADPHSGSAGSLHKAHVPTLIALHLRQPGILKLIIGMRRQPGRSRGRHIHGMGTLTEKARPWHEHAESQALLTARHIHADSQAYW
jgi:hypothetical protein